MNYQILENFYDSHQGCPTLPSNECETNEISESNRDKYWNDYIKDHINSDCDEFKESIKDYNEETKAEINTLEEKIKGLYNDIEKNGTKLIDNEEIQKDKQETEFLTEYRLETSNHNIVKLRLKYIIFIVLIFVLLIIEFVLIFL